MTIKQLQYFTAVVDNNFNMSIAAININTSQPGISKQIKTLEDSLEHSLFTKKGKAILGLTDFGKKVLEKAREILILHTEIISLNQVQDAKSSKVMRITSTSTYSATYLPKVIKKFNNIYPNITIETNTTSRENAYEAIYSKTDDLVILSGITGETKPIIPDNKLIIDCFKWDLVLICKNDNNLVNKKHLSATDLLKEKLVTYLAKEREVVMKIFPDSKMANIIATSDDICLLKNYVRQDVGVAIVSSLAYNSETDNDLTAISLKNFLPEAGTFVVLNPTKLRHSYLTDFLKLFSPNLNNAKVEYLINNTK